MKKLLYLLIILLSVFTISVKATNIEITDIELVEKTDYVEELSNPTIDDLKINFNIKFKNDFQHVDYKITVKNNSSRSFDINTEQSTKYVKYELLSNENTIENKSTKSFIIRISYNKEIDESLYQNNIYEIDEDFKVLLSGSEIKGVEENPKTGVFHYTIAIIIAIILLLRIHKSLSKQSVYETYILLLIMLLYPVTALADNNLISINAHSHIVFEEPSKSTFLVGSSMNEKMLEISGDNENNNILSFKRSNTLNNDYITVSTNDSDNPIYMWFDNGTIFYYSDSDNVYYNKDSSEFYYNLKMLKDIEYARANKIINANAMFENTAYNQDSINWNLSIFDSSNIQNAEEMFSGVCYNCRGDVTLIFDGLATGESLTNVTRMFDYFGFSYFDDVYYGEHQNNNTVSILFKNEFNAKNLVDGYYMFSSVGKGAYDIIIDLGDNFNAESLVNGENMFSQNGYYGGHEVRINLGKNFNAKSLMNNVRMFDSNGQDNYRHILSTYIDLGDNFNMESATNIQNMFQANGRTGLNVSITLGKNFNAKSVKGLSYMFTGNGRWATGDMYFDLGDNFNAESLEYIGENGSSSWGCFFSENGYQPPQNVTYNFGKNFNAKKLKKINTLITGTWPEKDLRVDFGDNPGFESAEAINYLIDNTYVKGDLYINFGDNFNTQNLTRIDYLMQRITKSDDTAPGKFYINFGKKFTTEKMTYFSGLFSEINSININNDITIIFPGFDISSLESFDSYNFAGFKDTNTKLYINNKSYDIDGRSITLKEWLIEKFGEYISSDNIHDISELE